MIDALDVGTTGNKTGRRSPVFANSGGEGGILARVYRELPTTMVIHNPHVINGVYHPISFFHFS
jgi:hypothetical protein